MNSYQRIHHRKSNDIENKRVFLRGAGIGSSAAAEYLMRNRYMKDIIFVSTKKIC